MGWGIKLKNPFSNITRGIGRIGSDPVAGLTDIGLGSVTGGQVGYDEIGKALGKRTKEEEDAKKKQEAIARGEGSGAALARQIYGQGTEQFGSDVQGIKERLSARVNQTDPVSEAIRSQKSGAVASAQRNLAAAGVKGGAAAGALEEIARSQNAQIAQSLYGQQAQSEQANRDFISNMISGSTALRFGSKAQAIAENQPAPPKSILGGIFA